MNQNYLRPAKFGLVLQYQTLLWLVLGMKCADEYTYNLRIAPPYALYAKKTQQKGIKTGVTWYISSQLNKIGKGIIFST